MLQRVEELPPVVWLAGAAVLGVAFLCWHSFERAGDEDPQWLDPGQPPAQVGLPLVPGVHGCGSPMSCNDPLRGRAYADTLAAVHLSIGGEL